MHRSTGSSHRIGPAVSLSPAHRNKQLQFPQLSSLLLSLPLPSPTTISHNLPLPPTMSQPTSQSSGPVHTAASTGYSGSNAANYHSIRPGYPEEVAEYVLQHTLLSPDNPFHDSAKQQEHILDVGCGTGKWTATLETLLKRHNLKYELVAADPVPSMTAAFAEQLPHIPVHTAAATELPFGDEHFDLLTAATAFHWFCDGASVRALYRILKPSACFAVVGYDLTVGNDWTQPMQQLLDSFYPHDVPYPKHGHWRRALDRAEEERLFEPVVHTVFREAAVMRTDRAGLVNRFVSASAIAALQEGDRARVTEQFNAIIDAEERFKGRTEFVMKDDIEVTIVRKFSSSS